mmetsp:Transcript_28591/g.60339  ORF Transcript_28591/g.60339 Transcript_28591/m.60339 type:complete len:340 (-) Transcript_28591:81-1100(-)
MKRSTIAIFLLLSLCAEKATPASTSERHTITTKRSREILCRGRGRSSSSAPQAQSTLLALRGGHSSSASTEIIATLASFAKTNPVWTAFLSCAINGLAADRIAQRSEAIQRRRQTAAVAINSNARVVRNNIRPSGVAFINSNNITDHHHHRHYERGTGGRIRSPTTAAAATLSSPPSISSELLPPLPSSSSSQTAPFEWDPQRSLAFLLYGGCYQGIACHVFYNVLFLQWFGPHRVWTKVAVSQFVMAPLLTLPCAYLFKSLVMGGMGKGKTTTQTMEQTLEQYWIGVRHNGLLISFWKMWIPVQILIFAVIPTHWRIPFSSVFSFLWTVMLSRKTNHA